MNLPNDLRYTSHDEWVRVDGNTITVGISDFAQDQLGELVHVELPDVDDTFAKGDAVAEVESVKAVAEVYAPLAGTITAINEDLDDDAEAINNDPYGCWLFKMAVDDLSALEGLMGRDAYAAKIGA
jgi:glycine cleavage system H protein